MSESAVIVAGGMGKRLGKEIPKAFVEICEKPIFLYSVEVFDSLDFAEIVIVVPESAIKQTQDICENRKLKTKIIVAAGGNERHNSVENGINATSADTKTVIIHDAARPFITRQLVGELLQAYKKSGLCGMISATRVVDTVRKFEGDECRQTVNRDELIAVSTPQIFDKKTLLDCFARIGELPQIPTDEAMLAQNFGKKIGWLNGSKLNFKITTPEDIILGEATARVVGENTKGSG